MNYARIEHAILAAREVAASPGAREVHRLSGGVRGGWSVADEDALRSGYVSFWNERARRWERFELGCLARVR